MKRPESLHRPYPRFDSHYAISADGQRVVFVSAEDTRTPVWLASLTDRFAPRQVTTNNAWKPYFGADGYLVFMGPEKGAKFVFRVKEKALNCRK